MYDYIKGSVVELQPARTVIECAGIGYEMLISLQTYEYLQGKSQAQVFVYQYIREDEHSFYGFATKMLSSLTDEEIRNAIIAEDLNRIKSVKGIGLKSAQRLVLELKDKIIKGGGVESPATVIGSANPAVVDEAATALVMLGFAKASINKVLPEIIKKSPDIKVEALIKEALKRL